MQSDKERIQSQQREQIQGYLDGTGWSATELARRAGLSQTTITRFLNKDVKHSLSANTMYRIYNAVLRRFKEILVSSEDDGPPGEKRDFEELIDRLGIRMEEVQAVTEFGEFSNDPELIGAPPDLSFSDAAKKPNKESLSNRAVRVAANEGQARASGIEPREIPREKTLPVYGAVEGGNDGMIVTPEPIDWVARPQGVVNAPDAFAVYVLGDSMEPRIEHGELVVVNPKRPVQRRNDVVLVREDPDGTWHALVKRVLDWSKDSWLVLQYNPRKEFELSRAEWKAYAVTSRENV